MDQEKYSILILEDDEAMANAIAEVLKRNKYSVIVTQKPEEALEIIKSQPVHFLIVDCLLPKLSGVEFLVRVNKEANLIPSILMSGIYIDKSFIKSALQKTQALAFLKKPFEIEELINIVKARLPIVEVGSRQKLYEFFANPRLNSRQKKKFIEALEEIDGYDLPYLYSLMVETEASGHLNIINKQGDVFGVSFSDGYIVEVDMVDEESFLGKLLIEREFVVSTDLDEILKEKSDKKIGERLLTNNLLSPHAFDMVLEEQMNIRLSKTIEPGNIKVNFVPHEVIKKTPYIDPERLLTFLHDWVLSKIEIDWLKAHYLQWNDYLIIQGPYFREEHPIFEEPLFKSLPNFVENVLKVNSIEKILEEENAERKLRALHLLFIKGVLVFGEKKNIEDFKVRFARLKKLWEQMENKNLIDVFAIMGGRGKVKDEEVPVIYETFIRILGHDVVDDSAEAKEYNKLLLKVQNKALEAHDVFSDPGKRAHLEKEVEKNLLNEKLEKQHRFEEAKGFLKKNMGAKAVELLREIKSFNNQFELYHIYYSLALLMIAEGQKERRKSILSEVDYSMMQVPPEEKHTPLYSYTSAYQKRLAGEYEAAIKLYEKALLLDPNMPEAKRDLNALKLKLKGTKPKRDFLNQDLTEVVSFLFGKKK